MNTWTEPGNTGMPTRKVGAQWECFLHDTRDMAELTLLTSFILAWQQGHFCSIVVKPPNLPTCKNVCSLSERWGALTVALGNSPGGAFLTVQNGFCHAAPIAFPANHAFLS